MMMWSRLTRAALTFYGLFSRLFVDFRTDKLKNIRRIIPILEIFTNFAVVK